MPVKCCLLLLEPHCTALKLNCAMAAASHLTVYSSSSSVRITLLRYQLESQDVRCRIIHVVFINPPRDFFMK
jgi:hypothetical protein